MLQLGEKKQERDGSRQREMHEKSYEDLSETEAMTTGREHILAVLHD